MNLRRGSSEVEELVSMMIPSSMDEVETRRLELIRGKDVEMGGNSRMHREADQRFERC